jgi:hypothetical protein
LGGVFRVGFFGWVFYCQPCIKAAGGLPVAALPEEDETARQRGVLSDRFTKESVVLTAPAKPKAGGGELQLSSMSALTNKTSSQSFFLRVLKAKKISIVEFFPKNSYLQCLGSGFIGSGCGSSILGGIRIRIQFFEIYS